MAFFITYNNGAVTYKKRETMSLFVFAGPLLYSFISFRVNLRLKFASKPFPFLTAV